MNHADKRLAIQVEDHSLEYGGFEGTIPAGEYGAGVVIIWDQGEYEPMADMTAGLEAGAVTFCLNGCKLNGLFSLVRLKKGSGQKWLLIKGKDQEGGRLLKELDKKLKQVQVEVLEAFKELEND